MESILVTGAFLQPIVTALLLLAPRALCRTIRFPSRVRVKRELALVLMATLQRVFKQGIKFPMPRWQGNASVLVTCGSLSGPVAYQGSSCYNGCAPC